LFRISKTRSYFLERSSEHQIETKFLSVLSNIKTRKKSKVSESTKISHPLLQRSREALVNTHFEVPKLPQRYWDYTIYKILQRTGGRFTLAPMTYLICLVDSFAVSNQL
jgi:hypothetical protein